MPLVSQAQHFAPGCQGGQQGAPRAGLVKGAQGLFGVAGITDADDQRLWPLDKGRQLITALDHDGAGALVGDEGGQQVSADGRAAHPHDDDVLKAAGQI